MTTQFAVGYINEAEEFRGTYVQSDVGDPYWISRAILNIADGDQDKVEEWIEAGIAGGGYVNFDDGNRHTELNEDNPLPMATSENYDSQNCEFLFLVEDAVPEFYDPKNVLGQDPNWLR